jgi:hypothetical protein
MEGPWGPAAALSSGATGTAAAACTRGSGSCGGCAVVGPAGEKGMGPCRPPTMPAPVLPGGASASAGRPAAQAEPSKMDPAAAAAGCAGGRAAPPVNHGELANTPPAPAPPLPPPWLLPAPAPELPSPQAPSLAGVALRPTGTMPSKLGCRLPASEAPAGRPLPPPPPPLLPERVAGLSWEEAAPHALLCPLWPGRRGAAPELAPGPWAGPLPELVRTEGPGRASSPRAPRLLLLPVPGWGLERGGEGAAADEGPAFAPSTRSFSACSNQGQRVGEWAGVSLADARLATRRLHRPSTQPGSQLVRRRPPAQHALPAGTTASDAAAAGAPVSAFPPQKQKTPTPTTPARACSAAMMSCMAGRLAGSTSRQERTRSTTSCGASPGTRMSRIWPRTGTSRVHSSHSTGEGAGVGGG